MSIKITGAALALAVCLVAPATLSQPVHVDPEDVWRTSPSPNDHEIEAPLDWTTPDGRVRFTIPAGWHQRERPAGDPVLLEVGIGDRARGEPGIHCWLDVRPTKSRPGDTQAALNARLLAGASTVTIDEKRVKETGGLVTMDGFLSMEPHVAIRMMAGYLNHGNGYFAEMMCGRHSPSGILTADQLETARKLFDTIRLVPEG